MTKGTAVAVNPRTQRWHWLDALRGFALFGILVVNAQQLFFIKAYADSPIGITPQESGVWAHWWLVNSLFDLKFFTLFTFLFGFSFVLQRQSIESSGREVGWIYTRRLLLLAVFGIIHAIYFYYADVLFMYALAGFALLASHKLSADKLFKVGLVLTAVSVVLIFALESLVLESKLTLLIGVGALPAVAVLVRKKSVAAFSLYLGLVLLACMALLNWNAQTVVASPDQYVEDQVKAYGAYSSDPEDLKVEGRALAWPPDSNNDIPAELSEGDRNAVEVLVFRNGPQHMIESLRLDYFVDLSVFGFVMYFFWRIAGLFMLSAALASYGMHKINHNSWQRIRNWCLLSGFSLTICASWLEASRIVNGGTMLPLVTLTHEFSALLIAATVLAQFYLWREQITETQFGQYLVSAGRMALTNYIAQSAVMAAIAGPHGLQMFGRLSHWQAFQIALLVFAGLTVSSHFWLKKFRMGPLEWVWRCATYLKWFPICKGQQPASSVK